MKAVNTLLMGLFLTVRLCAGEATEVSPKAEEVDFFERKVRPVFVEHCHKCHSADSKRIKGSLRVDSRAALLAGGDSGPAVVPGDPDKSLLIRAVVYLSSDLEMPPRKKLPDTVIEDLRTWVKQGAPWPDAAAGAGAASPRDPSDGKDGYDWQRFRRDHWAFRPVERPGPPSVANTAWPRDVVDRFVLARLEAAGMKPAAEASPRVWLRRAYIDLVGLHPTPEEVAAHLADLDAAKVPDEVGRAREKVVDRLLASPAFGQRWARHWLDVARYNDGFGAGFDGGDKPLAWRYRDWVINALDFDLPYDDFVRQQIAGDLLGEAGDIVATGFLAIGPTYTSDGGDPEAKAKAQADTLEDRMDTTFRGFQGLTVACARCHDHKFDPIPTEDYYSLAGIFQNTRPSDRPLSSPAVVQRFNEQQKRLKETEKRVKQRQNQAKKGKLPDEQQRELETWKRDLEQLRRTMPPAPEKVHAVSDSGDRHMHVALRGDLRKKGPIAPRRFLRIVAGDERPVWTKGSGRLALAGELASPRNPLTSRVGVNRIWQHYFGRGIVRSPSNFGVLGEKPTHPLLLDWLASELVERGWSAKWIHRRIALSATYGMSSEFVAENDERDGANRLLWRIAPRRLDAEAVRDSLLAVTGELVTRMSGAPERDWRGGRRRTIYSVVSRNGDRFDSDVFLRLFDFPSARISAAKREVSTVPQQFLFLMNSAFVIERARSFAARLEREAKDNETRLMRAYELLYGRPPTASENAVGLSFLGEERGDEEGVKLSRWQQYAQVLLCAHEFLHVQ